MRVNDKDVKDLIEKVNSIHTKVEVIESEMGNIKEYIGESKNKIIHQGTRIEKLEADMAATKGRMWVLLFVGSFIGGIVASIISKII